MNDPSRANAYVLAAFTWAADVMRQVSGIRPEITSTYRATADQGELYDQRLTNPYPVNRPGDSAHNVRSSTLGPGSLAIDSYVPDRTVTLPNGAIVGSRALWTYLREYVGFRVPANDVVHSEVPNWRAYRPVV